MLEYAEIFSNCTQPVFHNNNSLYSANKFYFQIFISPSPHPVVLGTDSKVLAY